MWATKFYTDIKKGKITVVCILIFIFLGRLIKTCRRYTIRYEHWFVYCEGVYVAFVPIQYVTSPLLTASKHKTTKHRRTTTITLYKSYAFLYRQYLLLCPSARQLYRTESLPCAGDMVRGLIGDLRSSGLSRSE